MMRRLVPSTPYLVVFLLLFVSSQLRAQVPQAPIAGQTQVAGQNINMVSGTVWPAGDQFLQRQNEPSMAVSSRNPEHLLAGANDYRTVDIPKPGATDYRGDAWLGVFTSIDGGDSWKSTPLPGYPQDKSGINSPLHNIYNVATDPTVRAGTDGMIYYSGLAFNRQNNSGSAVFVSTFQDLNNKGNGNGPFEQTPNGTGSPFLYLNTVIVDTTSNQFVDKPWIAVDVPRPGRTAICTVNRRTFSSGYVYLFYTFFNGSSKNPSARINVAISTDCGASWSKPQTISQSSQLNQGTVAAIDPGTTGTGTVYVSWRQEGNGTQNQPDQILYASSSDGGSTWTTKTVYTFPNPSATVGAFDLDENTTGTQFRGEDIPSLAVDGYGRVWVAFSQRVAVSGPSGSLPGSRIYVTTLPRGSKSSWTTPYAIDASAPISGPGAIYGHQLMPSLTYAFGRIMAVWLDTRWDNQQQVLNCNRNMPPSCTISHSPIQNSFLAAGRPDLVFTPTITDPIGGGIRHTVDVFGSMLMPSSNFNSATVQALQISQYKFYFNTTDSQFEQGNFNPPNLPMFVQGTQPFVGDYLDVAAQTIVPSGNTWTFNTDSSNAPVFHAAWTDNRDVVPPPILAGPPQAQHWDQYSPPGASMSSHSTFDPTVMESDCQTGYSGDRDQNVYTARITAGLVVRFKENAKPLTKPAGGSVQRSFSLYVRNTVSALANPDPALYRILIGTTSTSQACSTMIAGGTANFAGDSCQLDVAIPPRTTISRAIVVNSTNTTDTVNVLVAAIDSNGNFVSGGLQATAALNNFPNNPGVIADPDQIAFDPTDPDSTSPSNNSQIQLVNGEFYDPTTAGSLIQGESSPSISSPSISSPSISSPSIFGLANASPSIASPSIASPSIVSIASPSITAVQTASPSIVTIPNSSPSIASPSIASPSIVNLENSSPSIATPGDSATDYSFTITNKGDTSASYNAKEFVKQMGGSDACKDGNCQIIIHRTHGSPTAAIDQNTGQAMCTLAVQVQDLTQANIPSPAFSTSGSTSTDNSSSANNATVTLGPGEGTRVTLRVFGKTIDPPTGFSAFPIKAVAIGTVPDTGQTANPASLTITSTEVPVALVGNPYNAQLSSIGGVAPTSWFPFSDMPEPGPQPLGVPGFTLSPSGVISADMVTTSPGNNSVNVEVQDSATPVNTDAQTLSLEVNKFSATISAANSFTTPGSVYISANPGDKVTVSMMVHNDGPATATNVVPALLVQSAQLAGGGPSPALRCSGTQPPGPVTITGGSAQEFDYTCDMPTGNGFVTFTSSATADYCPISGVRTDGITCVNPALKVSASTGPLKSNQITVDTTPPTLNFGAVTPTPNAAGWNNTAPVTINYMTSDNLSGVASMSPLAPVAFTNQGPNQTTVVTVIDNAGNKATFTTPAVSIDTIAPVITAVASPAPNAAGWNNTPVTVTFNCVDNVVGIASGVATVTSPITLNNDGKNQSASGTCTDVAGNSANATASGINIDRTIPPVAIAAPTAGQSFVLNSTITPMYTCGDGSVDVVTCTVSPSPNPYSATPVGAGSFTVSALDQAGNANQASANYLVVYNFIGFQAPLQPAGPPSAPSNSGAFMIGSAIPVQLQLQDANGSFITDPSALTSVVAYPNSVCTGAPDGGAIPLYQNGSAVAPSTFSVSTNVYTLTWNTNGAATSCYNIVVTLKDTTQHATIVNLVTSGTATQFADGIFSNANWSSAKVFDSTPSSSATFTAAQVGSGGNPNEYRQVNMTFGQGSIIVGHLNPLAVYTPATQGAIGSITYSYDVREFNPPFAGAAVNYALLLLQNGTYYVTDPTDTFSNTGNWMNVGNANLTATQFSNSYQGAFQLPGAGPLHPDFSASGAPITFGYFSANTNTGAGPITTSSGIDNWSVNVSPFMNISGSEITGFYAANGAFSSAPNDLSTTTVSAFVPNGTGGFSSIAGVGKADGTFSILNVPAGFYWLQLGNRWLWTSEAIIDAGTTSEGRANAVHAPTTVNFVAVSGMSPWQPSDSLEYWTPNVYEVDSDIGTAPATGATSYTDSVHLQGLIDTSQGDVFYLMHLGGSIIGNYTIDAMEDVFSPSSPIMETPGSVNNFSGSFTQLAQNSTVHLAVNASQFAQFLAAAGPGATLNSSTFGVQVTTPSQELLFGNVDPGLFEFFRTDFGGISSDFDLGDEHYGDPFPLTYVRYYLYEQDFLVPFMSPGATLPGNSVVITQAITLTPPSLVAPLLPVVGPVSAVAINGTPFTQAMSAVGTTPTISWQAPTVGSATDYRVGILQLGINANGRSTQTRVATLSSTATNLQIPPGILMAGSSYLLEIVAVHRAGFDGQANLFKTKFPYGNSQIVTYQLSP